MKKLICILLAAATTAGCEKDDPTRYDMSQGRVCFPGAAPNETAEYPGYSNSDSTFYASMTFKQQPEGVATSWNGRPKKRRKTWKSSLKKLMS